MRISISSEFTRSRTGKRARRELSNLKMRSYPNSGPKIAQTRSGSPGGRTPPRNMRTSGRFSSKPNSWSSSSQSPRSAGTSTTTGCPESRDQGRRRRGWTRGPGRAPPRDRSAATARRPGRSSSPRSRRRGRRRRPAAREAAAAQQVAAIRAEDHAVQREHGIEITGSQRTNRRLVLLARSRRRLQTHQPARLHEPEPRVHALPERRRVEADRAHVRRAGRARPTRCDCRSRGRARRDPPGSCRPTPAPSRNRPRPRCRSRGRRAPRPRTARDCARGGSASPRRAGSSPAAPDRRSPSAMSARVITRSATGSAPPRHRRPARQRAAAHHAPPQLRQPQDARRVVVIDLLQDRLRQPEAVDPPAPLRRDRARARSRSTRPPSPGTGSRSRRARP